MTHLLAYLYLLSLVCGQAYAEEPEQIPVLEPSWELETILANESASSRSEGSRYGVYVEKVELASACSRYSDYAEKFYGGFVTNSRAWRDKTGSTHERFTTIANLDMQGEPKSSTCGAVPSKNNQLVSSWDWMQFERTFQDIRTKEPSTLRLTMINHLPQIYIPLYLPNKAAGKAYMLHIYPEKYLLGNPDIATFTDGILWSRHQDFYNTVYHVEIDVAGLIRGIKNFDVPNYRNYIESLGQVWFMYTHHLQQNLMFPRTRQLYLQGGSVTGAATEYICRSGSPSMDITASAIQTILKQEFKWL